MLLVKTLCFSHSLSICLCISGKPNCEYSLNLLILDEKIIVKPPKIKSFVELISFVQDRPGHDYRYGIDASKLKNELNWEPTTSLDLGLLKTVDWYISHQKFN